MGIGGSLISSGSVTHRPTISYKVNPRMCPLPHEHLPQRDPERVYLDMNFGHCSLDHDCTACVCEVGLYAVVWWKEMIKKFSGKWTFCTRRGYTYSVRSFVAGQQRPVVLCVYISQLIHTLNNSILRCGFSPHIIVRERPALGCTFVRVMKAFEQQAQQTTTYTCIVKSSKTIEGREGVGSGAVSVAREEHKKECITPLSSQADEETHAQNSWIAAIVGIISQSTVTKVGYCSISLRAHASLMTTAQTITRGNHKQRSPEDKDKDGKTNYWIRVRCCRMVRLIQ